MAERFIFSGGASVESGPVPYLIIDTKTGERIWVEGRENALRRVAELNANPPQ